MRMAWTIVAMCLPLPLGKDVLPDRLWAWRSFLADPLRCLEQLLSEARAHLVHLRTRSELPILELFFEAHEAIGLVLHEVSARSARVSVKARDHGLEEVRLALGADVVHRLLQGEPARLDVVAVDRGRLHA